MSPKVQSNTTPMPDPIRIPKAEDPDVWAEMKKKFQHTQASKDGRDSTRLATPAGSSYNRTTLG